MRKSTTFVSIIIVACLVLLAVLGYAQSGWFGAVLVPSGAVVGALIGQGLILVGEAL